MASEPRMAATAATAAATTRSEIPGDAEFASSRRILFASRVPGPDETDEKHSRVGRSREHDGRARMSLRS